MNEEKLDIGEVMAWMTRVNLEEKAKKEGCLVADPEEHGS